MQGADPCRPGWEENVHVVTDLDELIRSVRGGKVAVVLASSLNGLGRSLSHLAQVLRKFATHKVALIVPSQGINPSASPEVLLDLLGCIAEFKRSVAVKRINAGLNAGGREESSLAVR